MALSQDAINESELAKAKIANAEGLDEDYKRNLLNLINISTTATNGISPEEKIQMMTESIRCLAVSQVDFITSIKSIIILSITEANVKQCHECKAMKHAIDVEKAAEREALIAEWKKANGIDDIEPTEPNITWMDEIKKLLTYPGLWIFLTVTAVSPYGVDIVKLLISLWK